MNLKIIELSHADPTIRGWLKHWDAKNITWEQALEEIGKSLKQETLELITRYESYPKPESAIPASLRAPLRDIVEYFDTFHPEERILRLAQFKAEMQEAILKFIELNPEPFVVPIQAIDPELIKRIKSQSNEDDRPN